MTIPIVVLMAATPLVALFPSSPGSSATSHPVRPRRRPGVLPGVRVPRSGLQAANPRPWTSSTPSVAAPTPGSAVSSSRGGAPHRQRLPHSGGHRRDRRGVGETLIGRKGLGVEFSSAYNQLQLPGLRRRPRGRPHLAGGVRAGRKVRADRPPPVDMNHPQTQEVQMNQPLDRRVFLSRSMRVMGGLTLVSSVPILWGCGSDDDSGSDTTAAAPGPPRRRLAAARPAPSERSSTGARRRVGRVVPRRRERPLRRAQRDVRAGPRVRTRRRSSGPRRGGRQRRNVVQRAGNHPANKEGSTSSSSARCTSATRWASRG